MKPILPFFNATPYLVQPGGAKGAEQIKSNDYSHLIGLAGFSDTLLKNHFKLYEGYVANTNMILSKTMSLLEENKERTPEYAEMKRRLGWEYNGVLLHEYYFENFGANESLDTNHELAKKLKEQYGSFDKWKQDFISSGMMRGIGWVILYFEERKDRLINSWIDEHDQGHLSDAIPLLVMDVFEHAYMTDYQLDKSRYIESFCKAIKWETVAQRYESCCASA